MNKFFHVAAGAGIAAAMSLSAMTTQADGFYFGFGGYSAEMDFDEYDDDDVVPAGFLGYQFIDSNFFMLSAEAGYYDLGSFSGTGYEVDSDAFTLAGVGYIPIGPFFEIYGKLGAAYVNVDTDIGGGADVVNISESFDGTEAFGGVGFAFDILDTIDIYFEYLTFDTKIDTEMYGMGIRFDFF